MNCIVHGTLKSTRMNTKRVHVPLSKDATCCHYLNFTYTPTLNSYKYKTGAFK